MQRLLTLHQDMHPVLGPLTVPCPSRSSRQGAAASLLRGSGGSGECCTSFPSLVRASKVTFTAFGPSVVTMETRETSHKHSHALEYPGKTKLSGNLRHLWLGKGIRCHHLVCNFKKIIFYNCVGNHFMLES